MNCEGNTRLTRVVKGFATSTHIVILLLLHNIFYVLVTVDVTNRFKIVRFMILIEVKSSG